MGVLDVEDRVLGRLLLRELDVEVDLGRRAPRRERPAGGVDADLREQLVERHELAGPLRHRDLDALGDEPDPGVEQDLDRVAVVAHRLGGVPQPGHRPVVVGAPDVDQVVEAAAELLGHVADVGREVGRRAVRADHDPVLVVAERGRAEPQRAVLLVEVAGRPQALDRPVDPALGVERALALPDVEVDAEPLEAGLDPRPDPVRPPSARRPRRRRRPRRSPPPRRRRGARPRGRRRRRRGSRPRGPPLLAAAPRPTRRACRSGRRNR